MSLVRALLVVVAAAGLSQPVEAEVRRLILAAGANNGGVDRELLRYAVSDAEQFVEVLQEMGGLDPADVLLLRDPDLTAFEKGLADLGRRVKAASRRGDRLGGAAVLLGPRRRRGPAVGRRSPRLPAVARFAEDGQRHRPHRRPRRLQFREHNPHQGRQA